jgi:hypothetical protein
MFGSLPTGSVPTRLSDFWAAVSFARLPVYADWSCTPFLTRHAFVPVTPYEADVACAELAPASAASTTSIPAIARIDTRC